MAAGNVEWIESQKGKQKLICDEYLFEAYGKGKATAGPNVRYWTCATKGCVVRAKTDGNAVIYVQGQMNPGDHGHVNNSKEINDMKLKVMYNWTALNPFGIIFIAILN